MSKKHFRELAKRFHSIKPHHHTDAEGNRSMTETANDARVWSLSVGIVADVCQSANSLFDRGRFLHACENGL